MLFFDQSRWQVIVHQFFQHLAFPLNPKIVWHRMINFRHIFFGLLHIMYRKLNLTFREPESPVITINLSRGISKFIFFKLCSFAPFMIILSFIFPSYLTLLLYYIFYPKTIVWYNFSFLHNYTSIT